MLVEDVSTPHSQHFPTAEFMEKAFTSDFLVVISFNKPICKSDIINRLIVLIGGDALSREGVEFLQLRGLQLKTLLRNCLPVLLVLGIGYCLNVYKRLQVIRIIGLWAWLQVDKVAVIFSLALQ